MTDACIVWSACPDAGAADTIAETLVREGLAACVTVLPGVHSVYRWQGVLEREAQSVLMIKCQAGAYPRLESRLRALHPDQVPELLCVPVVAGLPAYLAWMAQAHA